MTSYIDVTPCGSGDIGI